VLAIVNAQLLTITDGIKEGSVLVDDQGTIAAVGAVEIPEGATIIDGQGKVLMPGMIDAHGHAGVWEEGLGFEGSDGNEMTDPITPHLQALDAINPHEEGIAEALRAGVTAMCILPGSANVVGGQGVVVHLHGNTVEEMIIKEDGGLKMAFGENPKRVYSGQKKTPSTRMAGEYRLFISFHGLNMFLVTVKGHINFDAKPVEVPVKIG
jgi:imidazolonepropionase-like amidohydrolase